MRSRNHVAARWMMLSDLRIVIEKVNGLRVLLWGSKDLLKPQRKGSV